MLRELSDDDFEAIHACRSDPEVALLTSFDPETVDQTHAFLATVIQCQCQCEAPRRGFVLAVTEARDAGGENRVFGNATLRIRNAAMREADIAFVLHRDYWGKGFGTEIARRLLQLGFEELGLHRIYATCRLENAASARILEKIGMRKEAHFQEDTFKNGRWWDTLLHAMLDHEWKAARGVSA